MLTVTQGVKVVKGKRPGMTGHNGGDDDPADDGDGPVNGKGGGVRKTVIVPTHSGTGY